MFVGNVLALQGCHYLIEQRVSIGLMHSGSVKANGREPKTCLGRVCNYKLGRFNYLNVFVYMNARPHLQLKTQPRFSPDS
jgi:hypothetical protein